MQTHENESLYPGEDEVCCDGVFVKPPRGALHKKTAFLLPTLFGIFGFWDNLKIVLQKRGKSWS